MNIASKLKAKRTADYDQGLEKCKKFLLDNPEAVGQLRQTCQDMQASEDIPTKVVGGFAMLGLLATITAIPTPEELADEDR